MTKPTRIAVCIPCGQNHTLHLAHALEMYRRQTLPADRFEVVVCFDNHTGEGVPDYPWLTKVTYRRDAIVENLPHRNHCRNKAAAAVSDAVTHLWFFDADIMPDVDLLRQGTALLDKASNPHAVAFHPVIWCVDKAATSTWLRSAPNPGVLMGLKHHDWLQPLTGYRARPSRTPTLETETKLSRNTEGYPCISREVFDLLGGFDQTYLGWGHNKEEFVCRLQALDEVCPYRLLQSVAGYRLTHALDVTANGRLRNGPLANNSKMFNALKASKDEWAPDLVAQWRTLCGS